MADDWTTYLLRFGELGIKGPAVRRRFEKVLVRNLEAHFERAKATCVVERQWGRIFLDTPHEDVARHAITHTFGLVSGSPAIATTSAMADIEAVLAEHAPSWVEPGSSFAVRARRTGEHPYSSMDLGRRGGSAIYNAVDDLSVDLDDPDVEVFVEVRNADAYVFTEVLDGPGGLPTGSQGKVIVPVFGVRSGAAAWLAMRRGATATLVVPEGALPGVQGLADWVPDLQAIVLPGRPSRAGLVAAARQVADRKKAHALVLDDHESRVDEAGPLDFPVLRPLAGLPGARWPAGARAMGKAAAADLPGPYTDERGAGPEEAVAWLAEAERIQM